MKRWIFFFAMMILFSVNGITYAQTPADTLQVNVDEVVASGFSLPVQVTHAGDGSQRLFVVEQNSGLIRIIADGQVLATPFLDVSTLIRTSGNEQGLLGLAFHPNYAENGYLYLNYTNTDGDTAIARYTVSEADPHQANPDTGFVLLTVEQDFSNHNGGQLLFGPDGYLYIGMGDGGSAGDPNNRAQDETSLLGALLRIDVDNPADGLPYGIPADNPYVGRTGADEIWAIGLRNPWRFSFDRQTGDLYIGDVGQNQWEEISYQAAGTAGGLNFGWDCREGLQTFAGGDCSADRYTDPIVTYAHNENGGRSVTGGFVYRGLDYPALRGYYLYGDFVSGRMWAIRQQDDGTWSTSQELLVTGFNISAFGEAESGELYVVDFSGGTVRRVVETTTVVKVYLPLIVR